MTTPNTREPGVNPLFAALTTPAPPSGGLQDVLAIATRPVGAVVAAPPVGDFKAHVTNSVAAGEQFTMNPDGMRECIADCDNHIDELRELHRFARTELYVESLGIGEQGLESARQLLRKYQEKARGGGDMPEHSSAVGYFQGLIDWVTDFRDGLQAALDAYESTDRQNAAAIHTTGSDL